MRLGRGREGRREGGGGEERRRRPGAGSAELAPGPDGVAEGLSPRGAARPGRAERGARPPPPCSPGCIPSLGNFWVSCFALCSPLLPSSPLPCPPEKIRKRKKKILQSESASQQRDPKCANSWSISAPLVTVWGSVFKKVPGENCLARQGAQPSMSV